MTTRADTLILCFLRLLLKGLLAPLSGHFCNERTAEGKKTLIARTQVVQPLLAIGCPDEAIFQAPSVAHIPYLTGPAVAGQCFQLGLPKSSLGRTLEKLNQGSLPDIPEAVFCVDEVVTGKEVSVVLDDRNIAAGRPKDTQ